MINHEERFRQRIVFDGMEYDRKIRPTDIDFLLDFNGSIVMAEIKVAGNPLTIGQKIAFQNVAKMWRNTGKQFIAFYCTHNTPLDQDVVAADTKVVSYLRTYDADFQDLEQDMTLKQAIAGWLHKHSI